MNIIYIIGVLALLDFPQAWLLPLVRLYNELLLLSTAEEFETFITNNLDIIRIEY